MLFEQLLTASLAVKYYLYRKYRRQTSVQFTSLYICSEEESLTLLKNRTLDFSDGIDCPKIEATIETSQLAHAVTRNSSIRSAHHDMILYSNEGPIPVQVKASFTRPTTADIEIQLKANKRSDVTAPVLIWMSLGDFTVGSLRDKFSDRVVFLNGSGVCNGMSIDMLRSAKLGLGNLRACCHP